MLSSILLVTVIAPAMFSRDPDARRGLKRMMLALLLFNAAYVAYVTLIHTAYHVPQGWDW